MPNTIRIATRKSPLALWQAEEVARQIKLHHPKQKVELVTMTTQGDIILDTPLAKIGGKGLFVKELETGMLNGDADIAVHSMKDVPMMLPEGLHLSVIMERENPTDAFVSNTVKSIDDLPLNARVGTCSLRRQTQLNERRDAIILASAGLIRLGFEGRIEHNISTEQSLPAIGQGAVGIECREDDKEINQLLAPLHHGETAIRVNAERALNLRLNGGCQVPIGGFAELDGDQVRLRGLIGFPDGSKIFRSEKGALQQDAYELGVEVAEELLEQGGDKVLELLGIDY